MKRGMLLGIAVALLSLGQLGCAIGRPRVESVGARITNIDLQGVDLAFDVNVLNSYPLAIRAPRGKYAINIAGSEFLKSDDVPPVSLPAGNIGTISLPARLEYTQLWQVYQSLQGAAEVPYTLEGALALPVAGQSFDIPFAYEGQFPVLRPPKLSILDVETSDISLSGARVAVTAEMKNPNVFALGLQDLGYALTIGGVSVGAIRATTADSIEGGATGGLTLAGELTAADALMKLVRDGKLGPAKLGATGAIQTPYGAVNLAP